MVDVKQSLRKVLAQLESEKDRIERHITAIRDALAAVDGLRRSLPSRQSPRRMSAADRRAISQRMKTYWAKRKVKAAAGKGRKGHSRK